MKMVLGMMQIRLMPAIYLQNTVLRVGIVMILIQQRIHLPLKSVMELTTIVTGPSMNRVLLVL